MPYELNSVVKTIDDILLTGPEFVLVKYKDNYSLLRPYGHMFLTQQIGSSKHNSKKTNTGWFDNLIEQGEILINCTHRLDFDYDHEFEIYLPHLPGTLEYKLPLVEDVFQKKPEILVSEIPLIICEKKELLSTLENLVRPMYFENNILPIIHKKKNALELPETCPYYKKAIKKYQKTIKNFKHGQFVYIGTREQVHFFSVDKINTQKENFPQPADDPFYLANRILGPYPLIEDNNRAFIFTEMGRGFSKYGAFSGDPLLITGDINEAITHMQKKTPFSEYTDIMLTYISKCMRKYCTFT